MSLDHHSKSFPKSFFAKEHKFNSLVESMNNLGIGLSIIDRTMRIAWVNQTLIDVFGPPEQIYGRHCYELYNHKKKVCPNCPTQKAFQTGKSGIKAIQRSIDKNGKIIYYHLATTPIRNNGRIVEVLELCQDITKKVAAEKERRKFQSRLKELNRRLTFANRSLALRAGHLSKASGQIERLNKNLKKEVQGKTSELNLATREIDTVYRVSREIISTLDLDEVFSLIAKVVCSIIKTKACILRMVDKEKREMAIVSSHGISAKYLDNTPLKIGEGLSGLIATTGKSIVCPQVNKEESVKYSYYVNKEGYQSALGVPIVFNDEVLGSIVAYDEVVRNYAKSEVILLSTFASQIAVAIKNAQLHNKVHLTYLDTVSALALAMEARDPYTLGHSERVTAYALKIAQTVGLSRKQFQIIERCGKLHDVGKIAVSDAILRKPGPLTESEKAVIRLHPLKGVNMLTPLKFLKSGLPLIRHHHERFDGDGYPQRLKGADIPIIARIFACADAFDAMTSDRPYRTKLTFSQAIKELEENAGGQFDPCLVKKFIAILRGNETK